MPNKKAPAFSFDALTLGEVAFIEDLSGMSITAISDPDRLKGKALAAVVTVAKRRAGQPDFTFNDALVVPMSEVNEILGLNNDEDEEIEAGE